MKERADYYYQGFSDADLVKLLSTGDHAAYSQIFERYWALLLQHAVKLIKDEDEATDVVQDIFTYLWVKHDSLDITTSLKSYLYSAIRNRIISKIRHSQVHEKYLDSLTDLIERASFVTDDHIRLNELKAQIEKELTSLPLRQRQIFELSRNQGLSHAQIAAALNISDETVKKQIYKALRTLKIKLDAYLLTLL